MDSIRDGKDALDAMRATMVYQGGSGKTPGFKSDKAQLFRSAVGGFTDPVSHGWRRRSMWFILGKNNDENETEYRYCGGDK